jgi:phosphoribosylformimino-5-aminoimidazole carboxamide ribotide isomerase
MGVAAIIYTDISRDGMLSGPNLEATGEMAHESPVPIIASGGISSLADLENLAKIPNITGAIVGKALYTGKIDLKQALGL